MKEHDAVSALDDVLDAVASGRPAAVPPELAELAATARVVRRALLVSPPPEVRAEHVRMLMEEAARLAGPQRVAAPARRHRLRRVFATLGALVGVALAGAPITAALASSAQPGQALYGTKLVVEKIELAIERQPAKKAALRLQFAQERIGEISRLIAAGKTAQVPSVAAHLAQEQSQAQAAVARLQAQGKASPVLTQQLATAVQQHLATLSDLADRSGCQSPQQSAKCAALLQARTQSAQVLQKMNRPEPGPPVRRPTPGERTPLPRTSESPVPPTPSPHPRPTPLEPHPRPTPVSPRPRPTPTFSPRPQPADHRIP
jgi:hypothetical protein